MRQRLCVCVCAFHSAAKTFSRNAAAATHIARTHTHSNCASMHASHAYLIRSEALAHCYVCVCVRALNAILFSPHSAALARTRHRTRSPGPGAQAPICITALHVYIHMWNCSGGGGGYDERWRRYTNTTSFHRKVIRAHSFVRTTLDWIIFTFSQAGGNEMHSTVAAAAATLYTHCLIRGCWLVGWW